MNLLGHGQNSGHGAEGDAAKVTGEAGDDDADIEVVGDKVDDTGKVSIKKLGFVDTDNDFLIGIGA